jgi:hypothetical protein
LIKEVRYGNPRLQRRDQVNRERRWGGVDDDVRFVDLSISKRVKPFR